MLEPERIELIKYRLEKAFSDLSSAELLFKNEDYAGSNNRAYYAIFHAIRTVLAIDGLDFKKHSAVIAAFQRLYVKTEIFSKIYSETIESAVLIRNKSDYNDFYIVSKHETAELIEGARGFCKEVKSYINTIIAKKCL